MVGNSSSVCGVGDFREFEENVRESEIVSGRLGVCCRFIFVDASVREVLICLDGLAFFGRGGLFWGSWVLWILGGRFFGV